MKRSEFLQIGSKFKNPFFSSKKLFFSNFLKLSGYDYQCMWCNLGVLFHPTKGFKTTLTLFENMNFRYLSHRRWNPKMEFLHPKIRFFQIFSNFENLPTNVFGATQWSCFLPKIFSFYRQQSFSVEFDVFRNKTPQLHHIHW